VATTEIEQVGELTERQTVLGHRLASTMFRLGKQQASFHARLSKQGFDRTAVILLKTLGDGGPIRSSALAAAVHSDPSTVSRQVASLVKEGLVERRADPEDGRASLLAATPKGLDMLAERRRNMGLSMARMTRNWEPGELEEFVELFERFVTDHEAYLPTLIEECVQRARTEGEKY
jgi:DNA-binding MarR family transcriptional regulator